MLAGMEIPPAPLATEVICSSCKWPELRTLTNMSSARRDVAASEPLKDARDVVLAVEQLQIHAFQKLPEH